MTQAQPTGSLTLLQDGQTDFLGGQDASKIPARVPPNSYFAGINTSISKGVPVPRWALVKRRLVFPTGGFKNSNNTTVPYAELFAEGRFQAMIPYSINGRNYEIIIINGVIFLADIASYTVTVISIQGGGNLNENSPRLNWSNAGNYLVIFDWPNFPVIFDGVVARRSDPTKFEVPISTLGTYNQNRLFIANAGNEFTAGDPTGNLATPEAPITFEEVEAPAASYLGQIFQLPTNYLNSINDPITAMGFLQVVDTSTGLGPLLVATKNYIYSFQAQIPRAQWTAGSFGTMFVSTAGIAGSRALVNVNSDLFILSGDGQVRSASMSRDEQHKWSRVPVSREVENWLKYSDPNLVDYAALGYFKNRIFATANPFRTKAYNTLRQEITDVAFGGFVVIGLDNLATLGRDGTPAWDGLWTGVRPMDLNQSGNRFFVMSKDPDAKNELYEFVPEQSYDQDGDNIRQITATIYTREFDFQNMFQNKTLHSLDVSLQNVKGDLDLKVYYKPSHGNDFALWNEFQNKAPWRDCSAKSCFNGFGSHNFKRLNLGAPAETPCDGTQNNYYNFFRKVQLKFEITAVYFELQEYMLRATVTPQSEYTSICDTYSDQAICLKCNNTDWAIGPFESCQHLTT